MKFIIQGQVEAWHPVHHTLRKTLKINEEHQLLLVIISADIFNHLRPVFPTLYWNHLSETLQ